MTEARETLKADGSYTLDRYGGRKAHPARCGGRARLPGFRAFAGTTWVRERRTRTRDLRRDRPGGNEAEIRRNARRRAR